MGGRAWHSWSDFCLPTIRSPAVMISLFLLLYIDELMDLSSISFLTFTMEGESELRASDAFIAKWLITSEIFSLCNCGCKVFNLKIRP